MLRLNVTTVKPIGPGHLTVYPCDTAEPEASNLNYLSGQVIANNNSTASSSGDICVFAFRDTDVIVDMAGWFTSGYIGATPKSCWTREMALAVETLRWSQMKSSRYLLQEKS